MKKFNKKGFTIVELVIVIAVIGILAGVLIPTFSGITQRANETAAMQEATSGRNAILALTEGQMPENTMFYILDGDKGQAEYAFAYVDGAMKVQDSAIKTPSKYMNEEYYVVYFSSDKLANNSIDATYAGYIAKYVSANATVSKQESKGEYIEMTLSDNTTKIHAYFSGDLNDSLIVFLGAREQTQTVTKYKVTFTVPTEGVTVKNNDTTISNNQYIEVTAGGSLVINVTLNDGVTGTVKYAINSGTEAEVEGDSFTIQNVTADTTVVITFTPNNQQN